jgi:hypothetical protein
MHENECRAEEKVVVVHQLTTVRSDLENRLEEVRRPVGFRYLALTL